MTSGSYYDFRVQNNASYIYNIILSHRIQFKFLNVTLLYIHYTYMYIVYYIYYLVEHIFFLELFLFYKSVQNTLIEIAKS